MKVDMRSDTVTKPSKEMIDVMFNAKVGDDVFEEDPSVNDDGIALKNIKIGDEITIDYRDFDDNIKTWLT